MPPFIAICANAGLPANRNNILEQSEVLGYQALDQPILLFGYPLRAAGQEECPGLLVCGRDTDRDQSPSPRNDGRAFDQQFDSGVADGAVVTETLSNADELVTVALGEPFRAVLRWAVGLSDAKSGKIGFGCFHSLESAGVSCEA